MRSAVLLLLLLLGAVPVQAQPIPALAQHRPATHTQPVPAAAQAAAPAIIPGSPLAALTGAAAQPAPVADTPAPFGTDRLGFVISGAIGSEAAQDFHEFLGAVSASTRLAPITDWLATFRSDAPRRAAAAILEALLIAVLPAAFVDAIIRLGLRRPALLCAQWALPRREEFLPDAETSGAETLGLDDAEAGALEGPVRRYVSLRAWARRLGFALLKFMLALLPLAGFVITAQVFLSSGFITARAAQLAVTGVANAYLACRAVQEVSRLVISPAAPSLRLITMPSTRARALTHWLLTVLATVLFAYSLISCALILGLPHAGAAALTRIAALVVHLQAAWGIWRCRRLVGGWIAGDMAASGVFAGLRHRLGGWWHYFALFYVLALWVAWAGGVQNAFVLLLRAVLVLIAALAVGRLAWTGSATLLERIFPDTATTTSRHQALLARARAYNPLIRFLIRAAIAAAVLLFVLQGWGVDALGWLRGNTISHALLDAVTSVLITGGVALAVWETVNLVLHARVERLTALGRKHQASRLRTLAPILRAALGTVIFLVALIVCLSQIGVNTTGLLAVSSIVGIAVGFGSQKLVQDIITGLFMLLEDAIQVGDVVTLAGMTGTVERLSIRTIRLRGGDGSVNIIPFSAVTTVTNMTRDFSNAEIVITVGYGENIDRVCAVLTDIGAIMRAEPAWGAMIRDDLKIFGLDKFGEQGLVISAQIRTGPGQHWAVRREFYRRVQQRFAIEGIVIPLGQQQTVFKLEMPAPVPAPVPNVQETK
jgi:small conductance mechanosensitive channel